MIPSEGQPIRWDELSWKEVEKLVQGGLRTVMWSFGTAEQHGFHLPLATDNLCSYAIAERVSALTGIPVLPPMTIGASESHGRFPGTLFVRPETLGLLVLDVVESLYRTGIRQLLMINGHMWNVGGLIAARDNIRSRYDDFQVKSIQYWDYGNTGAFDDCPEAPWNIHAEFGETSIVLATRPDLVDMSLAVDEPDYWVFWDYRMDQLTWSGVMGRNATGGSAVAGKEIIEKIASHIAADLKMGVSEQPPIRKWESTSPGDPLHRQKKSAGAAR